MTELDERKERFITHKLIGTPYSEIAKKIGVSRQTLYEWDKMELIRAEVDRRKQVLMHQGNDLILRDLTTYIDKIKELARDSSDKRVCLAANQYLINRIYGNPSITLEEKETDNGSNVPESELENEISKFKKLRMANEVR